MTLIEVVGFFQVVATEDFRIRVAEQALACRSSDNVVGAVAHDRSQHQQACEQYRVHAAAGSYGARDKEQRITRQERHDHQAGFAKNHQKQDGVDPWPVIVYQHVEVHIEVQDNVDRVEIHVKHLC